MINKFIFSIVSANRVMCIEVLDKNAVTVDILSLWVSFMFLVLCPYVHIYTSEWLFGAFRLSC